MHRRIVLAACSGLIIVSARPALAQGSAGGAVCPTDIPSSSQTRRAMAKEWFSKAETAESRGDPIAAVKAYQCSLRIVPHAFTAFNLGRLAERTGDLELALESFNTYLKLAPEAPDRKEIEGKAAALTQRINSLRSEQRPAPPPPPVEPARPTTPLPDLRPPAPAPTAGVVEPPPASSGDGRGVSPAVWALGAVGVAALAGAIVLNVSGRNKMAESRRLADSDSEAALAAWKDAKPRVYGSYALFGVAGAAAVADAILILVNTHPVSDGDRQMSLAPVPGGAVAGARFRF